MKNLLLTAGVALALIGSSAANALDFDFSFSDDGSFAPFNTPGAVTGEITGLSDNATSAAAHVFIDSFPTNLDLVATLPIDTVGFAFFNSFSVSGGHIVDASYLAQNNSYPYGLSLNFFGGNSLTGSILSTGNLSGLGGITFTPVPEPSTWGLTLLGFAGVGLMVHRRATRARRKEERHESRGRTGRRANARLWRVQRA